MVEKKEKEVFKRDICNIAEYLLEHKDSLCVWSNFGLIFINGLCDLVKNELNKEENTYEARYDKNNNNIKIGKNH